MTVNAAEVQSSGGVIRQLVRFIAFLCRLRLCLQNVQQVCICLFQCQWFRVILEENGVPFAGLQKEGRVIFDCAHQHVEVLLVVARCEHADGRGGQKFTVDDGYLVIV